MQDRISAGILDTAATVLTERGEAASMAEIAEAAGVGRATLYRYFPNREALLAGLAEAALQELRDRISGADLDTVPVDAGIPRLARCFLAAGSRYGALARSEKDPAIAERVDREIAQPVRDLLARGAADGTLRTDLPVTVLFEMFVGLLERALHLVIRKELGIEAASTAITGIFLDGARSGASSGASSG
jgi:TetR/AcrR family transcriptional repressor of mexCD-oprJ operon